MTRLLIRVEGDKLYPELEGRLLTGMVGVPVRFALDEEWTDFHVIAVFRCNDTARCVPLSETMEATIPWEVLQLTGKLFVGLEKRNGEGSLVVPTAWTFVERVCEGVDGTALAAVEATPCLYDKLLKMVENPPVRGEDYWTEADKQEMVEDVIAALPVYNGEVL